MTRMNTCLSLALGLICTLGCISKNGDALASGVQDGQKPPRQYDHPGMLDPSKANEKAPDIFKVRLKTTKGDFVIEVNREWSPNGADRFYNLVKIGYFRDVAFFRCIDNFMNQFGIHPDPAVNAVWSDANIQDDPGKSDVSNLKGFLTFAKTGRPNSRSVQFFINDGDNGNLDSMGFTPIGRVIEGMENFQKINTEYGENKRQDQGNFQAQGNAYILKQYPNLDLIKSAELVD